MKTFNESEVKELNKFLINAEKNRIKNLDLVNVKKIKPLDKRFKIFAIASLAVLNGSFFIYKYGFQNQKKN